MQIDLKLLPYLKPLLCIHEKSPQQPDNLCGPYWVSLLLAAYSSLPVTAVEVAIAAATLLPSHGNPAGWLPPSATSLQGLGYDQIPTSADIEACGTSITGLIQATRELSQNRFCLVPLQASDWSSGLTAVWQLCQTQLDWQIIPLLNPHTQYFLGSKPTLLNVLRYLQAPEEGAEQALNPLPADWSVGHFALLVGQLQGNSKALVALLDTYPQFGWGGLHVQPLGAIAQSLHRPDQATQGGIALFVKSELRAEVEHHAVSLGLSVADWDNGSPRP